MSQQNVRGEKAFTAAAALVRGTIVKLSAGSGTQVEVAGSDEKGIGVVSNDEGKAAGDNVNVSLWSTGRTFKVLAGEALAAGADLYSVGGKVVDTDPGAGTIHFKALEAASADLSLIEVLPV